MKTVDMASAVLDACVVDAQQEQVVLTRSGQPVALLIGLDEEQAQLGTSDRFWELITKRREEPALTRDELERRLGDRD